MRKKNKIEIVLLKMAKDARKWIDKHDEARSPSLELTARGTYTKRLTIEDILG